MYGPIQQDAPCMTLKQYIEEHPYAEHKAECISSIDG